MPRPSKSKLRSRWLHEPGSERTTRQATRYAESTTPIRCSTCLPASRGTFRRQSCTATGSRVFSLHWRTGHGAVGTEHATIATVGPQLGAAAGAHIKELASVGRHCFQFRGATLRTGDDRLKDHNV